MVEPSLEEVFPGLRGQAYQIKSPRDERYNCIAFAAGVDRGSRTRLGKTLGPLVLPARKPLTPSGMRSARLATLSATTSN